MRARTFHRATQSGAALLIGLILLLVMTVLGLSASNVSIMQERMAGNVTQSNIAFQRAEETLREIEQRLISTTTTSGGWVAQPPSWNSSTMNLLVNDCLMLSPGAWNWANGATIPWQSDVTTTGGSYIVVQFGSNSGCTLTDDSENVFGPAGTSLPPSHLVVARGISPTGDSEAIVQSIFYFNPSA